VSVAGDWIAVRLDIGRDPAVLAMALRLQQSRNEVVGALVQLWAWANEQLVDGNAAGVTVAHVDDLVGVTGFADALVSVGWLEVVEGGIRFPRFDAWNTESAKKRLLGARRAARHRSRNRNGGGVTNALPTGEESRVTTPHTPQGGEAVNGKPKAKPWEPKHPRTSELCQLIDRGRLHWREDVKPLATSRASQRAMDALLRRVDPDRVAELVEWLFGGLEGDYKPRSGGFDWRVAVKTGAALERNWDALAVLREQGLGGAADAR
jgi:hypothetical protein